MIATRALKYQSTGLPGRAAVILYLVLASAVVSITVGDSLRTTLQNQILLLGLLTVVVRMLSLRQARSALYTGTRQVQESSFAEAFRFWRFVGLIAVVAFLVGDLIVSLFHVHVEGSMACEIVAVPLSLLFLITPDLIQLWKA